MNDNLYISLGNALTLETIPLGFIALRKHIRTVFKSGIDTRSESYQIRSTVAASSF